MKRKKALETEKGECEEEEEERQSEIFVRHDIKLEIESARVA